MIGQTVNYVNYFQVPAQAGAGPAPSQVQKECFMHTKINNEIIELKGRQGCGYGSAFISPPGSGMRIRIQEGFFFQIILIITPPKNLKFKEKIQAKTDKMLGN